MGLLTNSISLLARLPTRQAAVKDEKSLAVPMRDGTVLLADRWFPQAC